MLLLRDSFDGTWESQYAGAGKRSGNKAKLIVFLTATFVWPDSIA